MFVFLVRSSGCHASQRAWPNIHISVPNNEWPLGDRHTMGSSTLSRNLIQGCLINCLDLIKSIKSCINFGAKILKWYHKLNLMSTKLRLIISLTHSLEANSLESQFLYEVKSHRFFKILQLLTSQKNCHTSTTQRVSDVQV